MIDLTDALVVTDSEAMDGLIRFALGRYWGLEVRTAADAPAAHDLIVERVPELVIVDMDGEKLDGQAFIDSVRDRGMRVVGINDRLTGPAAPAVQAGALAAADVPFQPAKLHAAIEAAWAVPA